ncbi:MAG: wax ester/triacylglycerol synthase family O-acyltransferase [Deltaproteobacteria bacterium]|nr:wax ester/triacylglycerol synthase family O-acyltransferase [Deltaproteobacteria bacterium]
MPSYAFDRLSVVDNSFLAIESPTTPQHVAAVLVLDAASLSQPDDGIDIDTIRTYIESRLHLIPRYRQRLATVPLGNRLVWVDDEHFNIHYHVRHASLPRPGDERQLKRLAARIVSQQLDRAKPLWEIWVVEGLDRRRFALVAKTHHCMVDGVSGVDLLAVLLNPAPSVEFSRGPRWIPRPAPTPFQIFRDEWLRRLREPLDLVRETPCAFAAPIRILGGVREALSALGETLGVAARPASPTPINVPIGPHRRYDWLPLDLDAVKTVKNRLGGTVNDIVLATVSGALRTFLEGRRVNVDVLELRASIPVSIRTDEQRGTLGNQIALWITELPVAERDPRRRLDKVRAATARLKESRQTLGARVLAAVSEWTSTTLLSSAVRLSTRSRPFNLVVTNVPGPQIPLYLLGAELRECYPMLALLPNQALGVALFSYAGRLCWGFIADWDLIPDLHEFVLAIEESFRELQAAAGLA